ncbi:MAG: TrkA family potassium uptake protein [Lachnospiraceae bacterium]|nr:TrkA family potassium uptake protein [Lachnospiraceae bacterium]
MKKSIAVLGLGNYGISLAKAMYDMGADVLVVDKDRDKVNDMAGFCTAGACLDLENEDDVASLDLKSMDIVVTAMGRNLAASIMAVAIAKEHDVPHIVAKSSSQRMSSILMKIGADKVIVPEEESGLQSARILFSDSVFDYFQVDKNLCMVEIIPQDKWIGKNIIELNLRQNYRINVVAIKEDGSKWKFISPQEKLTKKSKLLIAVERDDLKRLNID